MIKHPTGGTTMKSLVDHLSQYAAYHRDPRNIASAVEDNDTLFNF